MLQRAVPQLAPVWLCVLAPSTSGGGADGHGVDSSYVFVVPGARNSLADDMWSLAARLGFGGWRERLGFGGWRERWWPSQVHTVTHAPPTTTHRKPAVLHLDLYRMPGVTMWAWVWREMGVAVWVRG